ncbi:MAG: hypothetical protein ACTHMT_13175 [Verrucomicrobiota bacterium]
MKWIFLICFSTLSTFAYPSLQRVSDKPENIRANVKPSAALIGKTAAENEKPTTVKQLPNVDSETHVYTVDQAVALGFSFGSLDQRYSRRFYVKNLILYKPVKENDIEVWYGVGVRWVVNVRIIDVNAKLSGIPFIAAASDFKTAEATAQFRVIGMNNKEITKAAQGVDGDLNLDSYGRMVTAFSKITELIYDTNTIVTPLVVARVVDTDSSDSSILPSSLPQVWAMQEVVDGKTLQKAQDSFPEANEFEKSAIKAVYLQLNGSDDPLKPIGEVAKARARELLKGLKIK